MSPVLLEQKRQVNTARRNYQRCRYMPDRLALRDRYLRLLFQYQDQIREVKAHAWDKFVEEELSQNQQSISLLQTKIKRSLFYTPLRSMRHIQLIFNPL